MPSTFAQLLILVLGVPPGVTYQFARERGEGTAAAAPGDARTGAARACRLRRTGHRVRHCVRPGSHRPAAQADGTPAAAVLVRCPAIGPGCTPSARPGAGRYGLGGVLAGVPRRRADYVSAPSAWDQMFADRDPCFIRARLKSVRFEGREMSEILRTRPRGYRPRLDVEEPNEPPPGGGRPQRSAPTGVRRGIPGADEVAEDDPGVTGTG